MQLEKEKIFSYSMSFFSWFLYVHIFIYFLVDLMNFEVTPDVGNIFWKLTHYKVFHDFSNALQFSFGTMPIYWVFKFFGLTALEVWQCFSITIAAASVFWLLRIMKKNYGNFSCFVLLSLFPAFLLEENINNFLKWVIFPYSLSFLSGVYFIDFFLRYEKCKYLRIKDCFIIFLTLVVDFRLSLLWGSWGIACVLRRLLRGKKVVLFSWEDRDIYLVATVTFISLVSLFYFSHENYLSLAQKSYSHLLGSDMGYFSFIISFLKMFSLSFFGKFSFYFSVLFFSMLCFSSLKSLWDSFKNRNSPFEYLITGVLFFVLAILFYLGRYPFGQFRYLLFGVPLVLFSLSLFLSQILFSYKSKSFFLILLVLQVFSMRSLISYSLNKISINKEIESTNRDLLETLLQIKEII